MTRAHLTPSLFTMGPPKKQTSRDNVVSNLGEELDGNRGCGAPTESEHAVLDCHTNIGKTIGSVVQIPKNMQHPRSIGSELTLYSTSAVSRDRLLRDLLVGQQQILDWATDLLERGKMEAYQRWRLTWPGHRMPACSGASSA